MRPRIFAHGYCTDGFSCAYTFKQHFNMLIGADLSGEEIRNIPVFGVQPQNVQQGRIRFAREDIVLDLPKPGYEVLFWCDHHLSNKPKEENLCNNFWKVSPSCTGYLIDLAVSKGAELTPELNDFKKTIDINDCGAFSREDIIACYYPQEDYSNPSSLQKLAMIGAMFRTKDEQLNKIMFESMLNLGTIGTPLTNQAVWRLNPLLYHKAQLNNYELWRKCADTYIEYKEDSKTVLQDDRRVRFIPGVADRFYTSLNFPQSSYNLAVYTPEDGVSRVGMGSNILHKDRCKIDLGGMCGEIGRKFGGTGGGHYYFGGATIRAEKCDPAVRFILDVLKRSI